MRWLWGSLTSTADKGRCHAITTIFMITNEPIARNSFSYFPVILYIINQRVYENALPSLWLKITIFFSCTVGCVKFKKTYLELILAIRTSNLRS